MWRGTVHAGQRGKHKEGDLRLACQKFAARHVGEEHSRLRMTGKEDSYQCISVAEIYSGDRCSCRLSQKKTQCGMLRSKTLFHRSLFQIGLMIKTTLGPH